MNNKVVEKKDTDDRQLNATSQPCMIGTWAWGAGTNGSKMIFGKSYDKDELKAVFKHAYELGFYMWDTAEVYGYGNSERILGECIRGVENTDNLYLSTKHFPSKKYKEGAMRGSLMASTERLQVGSPSIYWIHVPRNLKENIKTAITLQKEHKIDSIGLSNASLEEIKFASDLLQEAGLTLGGIQNHYSLLSRNNGQEEIIDWCNRNHVTFYSYMVLEQGALSGHYDETHRFPLFSMRGFSFGKKKFRSVKPLLAYEKELASKYQVDPAQIAILWAIMKNTVPIIGITKVKYVDQLAKALTIKLLPEEIKQLESIASDTKVYCKGSWEPHK